MNDLTTIGDDGDNLLAEIARTTQSPTLRIMLDEALFEKAKAMAQYMANAKGFVPKHLEGNTYACFAVVCRAITWKMDPYAVAASTYQTPGGSVGYEGKLIQAVVENSGKLDPSYGGMKPEYYGDWVRVQGKFVMKTGGSGKPFPAPAWTPADEEGLGVIVRAKLRDESTPRDLKFDLRQAFPRNSTLWATDPYTQLWYAAVRRFANSRVPGLLLGLPDEGDAFGPIIDVTPQPAEARPSRASVKAKAATKAKDKPAPEPADDQEEAGQEEAGQEEAERQADDATAGDQGDDDASGGEIAEDPPVFEIVDPEGEVRQYEHPSEALDEYLGRLAKIARPGNLAVVRGFMETNAETITAIIDEGLVEDAAGIVMQAQQAAMTKAQPPQKDEGAPGDDEPPPPTSADDYGDSGGKPAQAKQTGDSDWLVPVNLNAKNSTGMVGYMRDLQEKLKACQHKGHVQQFNRANRENMVAAADKFRLAQLRELIADVDTRLRA